MANYSVLKAAVQAVVKTNGNQEITGANMQSTLISIINSLGTGYQFMGVATPSTSPGTPDYNVAYIGGAGTYANFGTSVTVPVGSIGVFKYNGSWANEQIKVIELKNINLAIDGTYTNNTVYINKLYFLTTTGGLQDNIAVNQTFVFGSQTWSSEFLVLSSDNTVSIKQIAQANNDIILLAWSRFINDYYLGCLFDDYISHKPNTTKLLGYLNVSSPYEFKTSLTDRGVFYYTDKKNAVLNFTATSGNATIAFLKDDSLSPVKYSDSYPTPIVVQNGTTQSFNIPNDCFVIYVFGQHSIQYLYKFEKTKKIHLRIGSFAGATGKPYVGFNDSRIADIKKTMIADVYIIINRGDSLSSISTLCENESYTFGFYDKDFNYLGYGTNIPLTAVYLRLVVSSTQNYTHADRVVDVTLNSYDKSFKTIKCGIELKETNDDIIWFTYPINNITYQQDNSDSNTYSGDNGSVVQNIGYAILPPNYMRNGKKCPVVIHCHGTGGLNWRKNNYPTLAYNKDYLEFIAKNGFVVIGCSTTTELYSQQYRDADIATPLAYSAYVELFRYITSIFNVDENNVSVFGYSGGGIMANMLGRLQPFKISCIASLAGSLDYVTNGRVITPMDGDANIFGNTLNAIPTTNQPDYFSTSGIHGIINEFMIQRFIEYKENICGLSPLFMGLCGIDIEDFMQELYSTYDATENYDNNTELQTLVSNGRIVCNVPIKIWHAIDDANVAYAISKMYVDMIHRAGGYAKLRTFPVGCGQHNAVGNSTNTTDVPFMNYTTVFGESINIPVAYGELVDWFRKWVAH